MKKDGKHILALKETQIGILKASLEYYALIDDYGHALWYISGGSIGRSDMDYQFLVRDLNELLENSSPVKANFGYWMRLERISKLLNKNLRDFERKAEVIGKKYGMSIFELEAKKTAKKRQRR